jgi:hypothetical protein
LHTSARVDKPAMPRRMFPTIDPTSITFAPFAYPIP